MPTINLTESRCLSNSSTRKSQRFSLPDLNNITNHVAEDIKKTESLIVIMFEKLIEDDIKKENHKNVFKNIVRTSS